MNFTKNDWALFLIRLVLGLVFVVHGYQKLTGLDGTTSFFSSIGIPLAGFSAGLVGAIELLAGLFLILGLWTKISAILIAIIMLVAILVVHLKNGFTGQGAIEFPLMNMVTAIAIAMIGSGNLKIKSFFSKN